MLKSEAGKRRSPLHHTPASISIVSMAVDLFSTVIIQTFALKATHAAKHALSTNYELKCEPVFCPRLSEPEAPFFFLPYMTSESG